MKRRSIVLAVAAALTLTVSAAAYQVPNLETRITEPYYGLNTDPQDRRSSSMPSDCFAAPRRVMP